MSHIINPPPTLEFDVLFEWSLIRKQILHFEHPKGRIDDQQKFQSKT
jgi:hypothetical protein